MTEQYQQASINLMPNAAIFQGQIGNVNVAIPGATVVPVPLQIVLDSTPLISHVLGSGEVEFLAAGVFMIQWSSSIDVASGLRKISQTSLFQDDGGGFMPVLGTFGYGYHRNVGNGEGTTTGQFRGNAEVGTRLQVSSQRISGAGELEFIASSCSLIVGLIPFR